MTLLKYSLLSTLFICVLVSARPSQAQTTVLLNDDFESYPSYTLCPAYSTDIQVYPTHGTNSTKGLRGFMNSFDSKDSLLTGWISPLSSGYVAFDFRIMEASALYPFIPASLNAGDRFSLHYSLDGQQFSLLQEWTSSNFNPIVAFTRTNIPVPSCDSARFLFLVNRTNNPTDYFVDIDNLEIGNLSVGVPTTPTQNDISILPTCFSEWLVIRSAEIGIRYEIMDQQGKKIISGRTERMDTQVNTADLPAGNYFIRTTDGKHQQVVKLIKAY